MKRIIVALLVGGALFATVAFAAATFTLNAGSLSQGQDAVGDCAGGGPVNLSWNTGSSNPVVVQTVDVNAPWQCSGATATVELFDNVNGFQSAASCLADANGDCNASGSNTDVGLVDWARVTLSGP